MVGEDQSLRLLLAQGYRGVGGGARQAGESGTKLGNKEAKIGCLATQRQDGLQRATVKEV